MIFYLFLSLLCPLSIYTQNSQHLACEIFLSFPFPSPFCTLIYGQLKKWKFIYGCHRHTWVFAFGRERRGANGSKPTIISSKSINKKSKKIKDLLIRELITAFLFSFCETTHVTKQRCYIHTITKKKKKSFLIIFLFILSRSEKVWKEEEKKNRGYNM